MMPAAHPAPHDDALAEAAPAAMPCLVCGGGTFAFFERRQVPVHVGVQWPTRAAALECTRGDLHLHACTRCGHVFNAAFDPARMTYVPGYDNALHHSARFQAYSTGVADRLLARYALSGRLAVEVGCGQGDFLALYCARSGGPGVGFDPSFSLGPMQPRPPGVDFVPGYYTEADGLRLRPALLLSRYVFEHLDDPLGFLRMVRRSLAASPDAVVYFEVPNVDFILHGGSVWDVIYEHVSYFGAASLAHTFERAGFAVQTVEAGYAGQFVGVEACPTTTPAPAPRTAAVAALTEAAHTFAATTTRTLNAWDHRLAALAAEGRRVVAWGAGAKAVSLLGWLPAGGTVEAVVDINPNKWGRFLPGGGQPIVAPEHLLALRPDVLLVLNPIYADEIRARVMGLGLAPDFLFAS